jgi:hypothetical protein
MHMPASLQQPCPKRRSCIEEKTQCTQARDRVLVAMLVDLSCAAEQHYWLLQRLDSKSPGHSDGIGIPDAACPHSRRTTHENDLIWNDG